MPSLVNYQPYLDWIDTQKERMIGLVQQWANINSGSENIDGINKMRASLKEAFSPLGDTTEEIVLSPRIIIDDLGILKEVPTPDGLSIRKRANAPRQIFLNGHMDTVFGLESPFQTCRYITHNCLNGPGVTDLKGGLVILLIALEALERSPFCENIGWEAFFNPDEAIGSVGSTPYLEQRAPHYDIGIIVEPQFPDGAFASARKGSTAFALVAKGKSAHAGRDFHLGVNAVAAIAGPLQRLHALNNPGSTTTLNIGSVRGGTASNIVPDLAIARFGVRAASGSDLLMIREQVYSIIEEAKLQGHDFELHQLSDRAPKPFDEETQRLFAEARSCAEALNITMSWRETGGVCDGNTLAAMGLPTIDSMGAAGGSIHTVDEYIELDKLVTRAQHIALMLMRAGTTE
ncbi:MAG: hydrolase [Nitrosomonas sp.]|nr:MAG: hydrolase [Nitrosomonas sp.]